MQNDQILKQSENELSNVERKIERIKFCIISTFKSQQSRNNLLLFTLDNPV